MQGRKVRNITLAIVCAVTAAVSFWWVTVSKAAPQADQMMICQYADAFNMGDLNGVLKGRYIARYPQQLGMVTLLRGLFALFGPYHYQAFQYLMVAVVPLIVLSGCMIVRILSDDNARVEIFYLLFMLTCFPMYIYTVFVYGNLISTALGLFGVWMYLAYLKKFSWVRLLLFGVSMGAAVQLRANLAILAAAMAIVLLIRLIVDLKWQNIVIVAALVLGVALADMAVWSFYSEKAEGRAPSIPPLLFIVMGLNDANGHPGWYNAYNYIVFAEHDDDKVAFSRENVQYPAVVVYGDASPEQAWYASNELWPYERVLYVDYMNGENTLVNETLQTAEKLIVYMDHPEDMLERIIERNDNLSSYRLVRQEERFAVYMVE